MVLYSDKPLYLSDFISQLYGLTIYNSSILFRLFPELEDSDLSCIFCDTISASFVAYLSHRRLLEWFPLFLSHIVFCDRPPHVQPFHYLVSQLHYLKVLLRHSALPEPPSHRVPRMLGTLQNWALRNLFYHVREQVMPYFLQLSNLRDARSRAIHPTTQGLFIGHTLWRNYTGSEQGQHQPPVLDPDTAGE